MIASKPGWTGKGDDTLDLSFVLRDKNQALLHLGPQRIRMFGVTIAKGENNTKPEDPVGPVF
jgi:hypothetical protein